ncbi:hypothetical protein AGDE_07058 [Angomonas deanei]|nr:hypothetical protein AGDE_07058 [Angomonas deanei]|eukprot:EPY36149.1 hypothetical protein AGDE_07058 [Angomonas deanei]
MPKELEKVKVIKTSLDYESDNFKEVFDHLVERIVLDKMEEEEDALIKLERERNAGKATIL